MYDDNSINSPDGEVLIDKPHRGDIRCRLLTIGRNGSVFGNVVATEVRVAGRFDGTVHASCFLAAAGSKVFGAINAATVGIKPGASVRAHVGPEFPAAAGPLLSPSTEEAILKGVEQAAKEEIGRLAIAAEASSPARQAVAVAAAVAATQGGPSRKALPPIV